MNQTAYPYSNALSRELTEFQMDKYVHLQTVFEAAVDMTRDYEHGSAEIELLNLDNIEQFKNVILDYMLYLSTILQENIDAETDHRRCDG